MQGLTDQEQKLYAAALLEARARGLPIPSKVDKKNGRVNWTIGSNGYFVRSDAKLYVPTVAQSGFISSLSRFVAFTGGRGSGKTAAGAQKALLKVMQGESGAVLNPDFQNFVYSTWPELREWIPWDMVVPPHRYIREPEWQPHKPFKIAFINGAIMFCKGLRDPDSARGPNINWMWYDEGSRDLTGMGWKLAVASVRTGFQPQAWTTATPRGKNHWLYELFVEEEIPAEALEAFAKENRRLVERFEGTIEENRENLDPGFFASMLATYPAGWLREQELRGGFVDEGGVLGNPKWFENKILDVMPEDVHIKAIVRYWDLAASEKTLGKKKADDPDETVGTLMGWDGANYYIMDQVCGWWPYDKIKEIISLTADVDGPLVPIYVEQEPGAGGKNQVADIAAMQKLARHTVRAHKPEGDKIQRALIWFGEAARGQVYLIKSIWNKHFLDQLSSFPLARHDDCVDSVSGARLCVAPVRQWKKVPFLAI